MDQKTHAWIAIRAVALLEDKKVDRNLVALLKPHVHCAAIGAWIPDLTDAKRGGGQTQHHVLKNLPYDGTDKKRFVALKDVLLGRLAGGVATRAWLDEDGTLNKKWWSRPYRADPKPGQHIANRAMALSTSLRDLLIIGDPEVDKRVPGTVKFLEDLDPDARTSPDQAALYCFMLSHFLADACMPCHCDGRKLAGYGQGLHEKLERHWSDKVGSEFDKKYLLPDESVDQDELLAAARERDGEFDLEFGDIPGIPDGRDVWLEVIDMARASFAVASIIVPEADYPYDNQRKRAPFEKVLGDGHEELLQMLDRVAMHDAVMNTAMVWRHLWNKISRED